MDLKESTPLSIPQLIDGLCLPSARELDELEHNLRRRILYDIYLASSYVTHAVGGAIADSRVALHSCHHPGTYSRNLQRLVQEQRQLRQQHPLTQKIDTTITPKAQGQEPLVAVPDPAEPCSAVTNPDGTITPHRTNNNSTTDASTSSTTSTGTTSTTTFPTPAALANSLRADHLHCDRTCTNLRTRIIDTFSSGSRSRSRSRNNRNGDHHPNKGTKPNLPAIIQSNLQWFSHIASRNGTHTRYIRDHHHHSPSSSSSRTTFTDEDETEQERHQQRAHHRRQVTVAFEDVAEAEWEGPGPQARNAARRRLITACWEWQGWLARGELGRLVGPGCPPAELSVMGRMERRVLGEELVWRREGKV
ncbi:hypothetical protein SLS54_002069 [Diplodia seriata]